MDDVNYIRPRSLDKDGAYIDVHIDVFFFNTRRELVSDLISIGLLTRESPPFQSGLKEGGAERRRKLVRTLMGCFLHPLEMTTRTI